MVRNGSTINKNTGRRVSAIIPVHVFGTSAVTATQLAAWVGLALVPLAVLEVAKVLRPGRAARP